MRTTSIIWLWPIIVTVGCGPETIYEDTSGPFYRDGREETRDAEDGVRLEALEVWVEGEERVPEAATGDSGDLIEAKDEGKPDGCMYCSPDKIAGKERVGCKVYTCENGCLIETWVEYMGACADPARCLRACTAGDTSPECGVCVCDAEDCSTKKCVSADVEARAEPDQDGCKAEKPCRTAVCAQVEQEGGGKAWQCAEGPDMPEDTACSDGDPCTLETRCQAGECVGVPMDCEDGNPCTRDWCEAPGVCQHGVTVGAACDDSDPCTLDDQCTSEGQCAGTPKPCPASGPCFRAWCDQGACVEEPLSAVPCDDGDPCSSGDACVAGACLGQRMVCEPKAPCLSAQAVDVGGECQCLETVRVGWCYFQVAGQGVCVEVGKTDPTGCFQCVASQEVTPHFLAGKPCDDGDPCTVGDLCSPTSKRCAGTPVLVDPTPLACQHPACDGQSPVVGVATDPGWCVHHGKCYPEGAGIGPCKVCAREGGTWKVMPVDTGTRCEDGNVCTTLDACDNEGECRPGWAYSCEPPAGGCATVACDGQGGCTEPKWIPTSGKCLVKWGGEYRCLAAGEGLPGTVCMVCDPTWNPFSLVPSPPGTACDPLDCCRQAGVCDGEGNCIAGPPASCDDGNPCTLDYCLPAMCPGIPGAPPACGHKPTTDPKACTDACGQVGTCVNGLCETPLPCNPCPPEKCDDWDPCTDDLCDLVTGSCTHVAKDCDDKDPCTRDSCVGGQCEHEPVSCDDGNPCTEDWCDSASGECLHEGVTGPACDDGERCTQTDQCEAGVCKGKPVACPSSGRPCHAPACDPATGQCIEKPMPDGSGCDDGNPCNAKDQCQSGVCLGLGACGGAVVFAGSQVVACEGVPLLGQTLTIQATVRWEDPSGPGAFQTIASLVGQDVAGKPHGVELLVGTSTSPSAGYCAPARRLVLRVVQHGQSYLVGYTAQAKVPVGEWTLVAVTIGSAGVAFVVGGQVVTGAVRCDTGAAVTILDLPQVPTLTASVGGVVGPDGGVSSGARMTVSDLTIWDVVVPPGPPSYAYPNLWCLFVAETSFEHHEVRPVLALRFNDEDQVPIQEGWAAGLCRLGLEPSLDPADPDFTWDAEPFRTGCPGS